MALDEYGKPLLMCVGGPFDGRLVSHVLTEGTVYVDEVTQEEAVYHLRRLYDLDNRKIWFLVADGVENPLALLLSNYADIKNAKTDANVVPRPNNN